jgi:hypothetical protein
VPTQIGLASPEYAIATALVGDLVLLQTVRSAPADFLNVQPAVVAGELTTGRHSYREVSSFELPWGRRVALLVRRCVVDDEPTPGPSQATLEHGLELASLEAARHSPGLVPVRTRHRARSGSYLLLASATS